MFLVVMYFCIGAFGLFYC